VLRSRPATFEIRDEELFWEADADAVIASTDWHVADAEPGDGQPPTPPEPEPELIDDLPTWAAADVEARSTASRSRRWPIRVGAVACVLAALFVVVALVVVSGGKRETMVAARAMQAAQANADHAGAPMEGGIVAAPARAAEHRRPSSTRTKKARTAKRSRSLRRRATPKRAGRAGARHTPAPTRVAVTAATPAASPAPREATAPTAAAGSATEFGVEP
jgi:hypothetical protein